MGGMNLATYFLLAISALSPAFAQTTQTLTANPTALTFTYQNGAALPIAQSVQVQSAPVGLNFSTAVSGTAFNAAWLLVSASTGKAPFTLKVQVNPTGLPAGSYAGTVTLTGTTGASPPTAAIAVTLVISAAPPTISSSPQSVDFTYVTRTPIPAPSLTSSFILWSNGAPLSATMTVTGATWLKINPTGNISLVGLFNTITLVVDPTGLTPKVYNATVKISAPASANKNLTVNVSLTVNAAPPTTDAVWPTGVIQASPATVVTLVGSNFFSNTIVAATGVTSEAKITVSDGATTASVPLLIPVYPVAATQLRFGVASPMVSGVVGTPYLENTPAAGGTAPYAYALTGGVLPPGLAVLPATGIGGTPTAAGTYTFTLRVTDSSAGSALVSYQEFQVTIFPIAAAGVHILGAATALPAGNVGSVYAPVALTAVGGAPVR